MARLQELERLFGTWLELSKDKDLLALLALIQHRLRQRGFDVSVEIARQSGTSQG